MSELRAGTRDIRAGGPELREMVHIIWDDACYQDDPGKLDGFSLMRADVVGLLLEDTPDHVTVCLELFWTPRGEPDPRRALTIPRADVVMMENVVPASSATHHPGDVVTFGTPMRLLARALDQMDAAVRPRGTDQLCLCCGADQDELHRTTCPIRIFEVQLGLPRQNQLERIPGHPSSGGA